MIFYFFWSITLLLTVAHPFLGRLKRPLAALLFICSIWLTIGIASRTISYTRYLIQDNQVQSKRDGILSEEKRWLILYSNHQTSREVLLSLAQTEYRLGNVTQARQYLDVLERIDPNNINVQTLENKLR